MDCIVIIADVYEQSLMWIENAFLFVNIILYKKLLGLVISTLELIFMRHTQGVSNLLSQDAMTCVIYIKFVCFV